MKMPRKALVLVIAAVLLIAGVLAVLLVTNPGAKQVSKIDFSNVESVFKTFITREGAKLMDGDTEFRTISVNAPTLLVIEDNYFHLPSNWEIDSAFQTFRQIGASAVRTYTLSIKKEDDTNGQPKHVIGPNGALNEEAFVAMDNVLAAANKYGVRLIIPFIDQYSQYPNGGIGSFAALRGKKEDDFWSDDEVKSDFKALLTNVLNRVNTVTGIAYKDDKAILAWETGNEIRPVSHTWTNEMAAHIKSIDKNHLVADGKYGIDDESLSDDTIDIVSNHYYPSAGNYGNAIKNDLSKASWNKPFIVGEFGFKKPEEINELLGAAIEGGASGAFLWSLRYPNEEGGFYPHSEGQFGDTFYAAYRWPGFSKGDSWQERETLSVLQKRAFEIRGLDVPAPAVPEAPVLLSSESVSAISWQESVGAASYEIQRREGAWGKWVTINATYEDSLMDPGIFDDMTAKDGKKYYYRVAAQNAAGKSGYSNILGPIKADHVIIDEIRSGGQYFMEWAKIYEKTQDIIFDRANSAKFGWDRNRIVQRSIDSEQFVAYASPSDIDSFSFITYIKPQEANLKFRIMVSADDSSYEEIASDIDETPGKDGNMTRVEYHHQKVPAGCRFIRVIFPKAASAELGRSVIGYVNKDGAALEMPARKSKPLMSNGILKDDLQDDVKIFDRSPNLGYEVSNPEFFDGDTSRLCRNQNTAEYVIYQSEGVMNYVKLIAHARQETTKYKVGDFVIAASSDGSTYADVPAVIKRQTGEGWWERQEHTVYALPEDTKFLRVTYPVLPEAGAADTWNPQIGSVEIGIGGYQLERPAMPKMTVNDQSPEIDAFENYTEDLQAVYIREESGDVIQASLDKAHTTHGEYSMKLSYDLGATGWSGVVKTLEETAFDMGNSIELSYNANGSEAGLSVHFTDADGDVWKARTLLGGTEYATIAIPFNEFTRTEASVGMGTMDLSMITQLGLYIDKGRDTKTSGEIFIDHLQVVVNPVLDNAEYYADPSKELVSLKSYIANKDGNKLTIIPTDEVKNDGNYALACTYTLDDKLNFAGATKFFGSPTDLSAYDGLDYWVKPDGSNNRLVLQVKESNGEPYDASFKLSGTEPVLVRIPWHCFKKPGWYSGAGNGTLDPNDISEFSIYINMGDSGPITSTLIIDSIQAAKFGLVDSFENYYFDDVLQASYARSKDGGKAKVTLETSEKKDGDTGLKMVYDFSGKGWAGVELKLLPDKWSEYQGLQLWLKSDVSSGMFIRIFESDGEVWKYNKKSIVAGSGEVLKIPFEQMSAEVRKDGLLDLSSIHKIGVYVQDGAGQEKGTLFIDSVELYK